MRILIGILTFISAAYAQPSRSAPVGPCSGSDPAQLHEYGGDYYGCLSSVWTKMNLPIPSGVASKSDVANGSTLLCVDTGTVNAMTCAMPSVTSYVTGMVVQVVPANTNSGAATLAINALTAIALKRSDGSTALSSADYVAGRQLALTFDGTVFRTPATLRVLSGTAVLGTTLIAANTCASTVTVSATGTLGTDVISWTPNANLSGVTGYGKASADGLIVYPFPAADSVNFAVCNSTGSDITPGAATLNWRVPR